MSTDAEDALADLYEGRGEAGLAGFRPNTLARVVIFSDGSPRSHLGEEETPVTEGGGQPPKIVQMNAEERTIGGLPEGTLRAGPITPAFAGGGTAIAFLRGADIQQGDRLYYRVKGPLAPGGALYAVREIRADRALRHVLVLVPRELENNPDE